ncbi:MAG: hypothetical protein QXI93_04945, partial [Candidatus Methanomethylicia archaeon]
TTVDGIYIVIPKGPAKFVIKRHKFGFSQSYLGTDWLSVSDSPFKLSPSEISILFDIVNIAPSNFTLDKEDDEPVFSAHSRFKQVGEGGNVLYCDGHVEWKPLIINDIVKQKILTKTLTSSDLADPNVGKNGNWFRPSRLNTDSGNEVFYPISVP